MQVHDSWDALAVRHTLERGEKVEQVDANGKVIDEVILDPDFGHLSMKSWLKNPEMQRNRLEAMEGIAKATATNIAKHLMKQFNWMSTEAAMAEALASPQIKEIYERIKQIRNVERA